jgi:hypothetical protein
MSPEAAPESRVWEELDDDPPFADVDDVLLDASDDDVLVDASDESTPVDDDVSPLSFVAPTYPGKHPPSHAIETTHLVSMAPPRAHAHSRSLSVPRRSRTTTSDVARDTAPKSPPFAGASVPVPLDA